MHPLFIIIPGILIAAMLAKKQRAATPAQPASPVPSGIPTSAQLPSGASPSANTANYMQHVQNAIDNVTTLQNPAGASGQLGPSGASAMIDATSALGEPIDTLTAQKDLNLLGADPALVEDGIMGPKTRAAISAFQTHVNLPATGSIDPATAASLRMAVAAVATS